MDDDEPTATDLSLDPLSYAGPPTLEERLSPFHEAAPPDAGGAGAPGGPGPGAPTPPPAGRTPAPLTLPGVGGVRPAFPPAKILQAPAPGSAPGSTDPLPGGPTVPDGLPMMSPSDGWEGGAAPEGSLEEEAAPTLTFERPGAGQVPAPDDPKVQISKSMQWDLAKLGEPDPEDPAVPPKVRAARMHVSAPTEVMPALSRRRKKKERSDAWLAVGLAVLFVLIVGLLAAVIVGVLQRVP